MKVVRSELGERRTHRSERREEKGEISMNIVRALQNKKEKKAPTSFIKFTHLCTNLYYKCIHLIRASSRAYNTFIRLASSPV